MPPSAQATDHLWFLDTLVSIRIPMEAGADGMSVIENWAPFGDSPPLHVHQTEDEIFHILEGEFRFQVEQEEFRLGAGEMMLAPKGVAHTYRVESADGGRWLTITSRGDFERFVRAMGRRAERRELPDPSGPPSAEAIAMLTETARAHHIELVGPPLH
jgi:mannose-6-phosphate isomerase-like protein (cupin superfamily)